jgi:hypothetical protein
LIRGAVAVLSCLALLPRAGTSQQLRGTVQDSATGQPVPGAVLLLTDAGGRILHRDLADARGAFIMDEPPAARRLRVLHIGYRPADVTLPATAPIRVSLVPVPVLLADIMVTGVSHCPVRRDTPAALALLAQARAGLLAVMVARERHPAALDRLTYEREYEGTTGTLRRQVVRSSHSPRASVSFAAERSPADFVTAGFAAGDGPTRRFLAPDADVLLDDTFARGYCFRLADAMVTRPHQVGLRFAPVERAAGRIDIDGVLWLDTLELRLVDIEFNYVGLDPRAEELGSRGRIWFRTMPNAVVMIDRWHLRLIGAESDSVWDERARRWEPRSWVGVGESGGELARAIWPDGREWRAPLGRVRLWVQDAAGLPVPGLRVRLMDSPYEGRTDSAGSTMIGDLLPFPYVLAVADPRLAPIALDVPLGRFRAVRDSTVALTLRVRSAEDTTLTRCGRRASPGAPLIIGRAVGPDGAPLGNARVRLNRMEDRRESSLSLYTTGSDGIFAFCHAGVARGDRVTIEVSHGTAGRGTFAVVLGEPLTVVRAEVREAER